MQMLGDIGHSSKSSIKDIKMEDLAWVSNSWLYLRPTLVMMNTWGTNQHLGAFSVYLALAFTPLLLCSILPSLLSNGKYINERWKENNAPAWCDDDTDMFTAMICQMHAVLKCYIISQSRYLLVKISNHILNLYFFSPQFWKWRCVI